MNRKDPEHLLSWAAKFCRLTRGTNAGKLIELRPWQKKLLTDLTESGARRAYVQMSRKNGKSLIGAILALYTLAFDREQGAEVYSVAGSRDQARIIFDTACRMVTLDPSLSRHLKVMRYEILHPRSGSRYKVIASDAGHAEGLNPSTVIFDEIHVLGSDRKLWDVMNLGSGTREAPMTVGITTPGVRWGSDGHDSLAWTLYDHGKRTLTGEISDPSFFFRCWEAQPECDVWDRDQWKLANPALGDFLSEEEMASAAKTTPENEYRTKRLGQWVTAQTAWMPYGSWDACSEIRPARPDSEVPVVLGFDGSFSGDSTALVAATIEPSPYVYVVGLWEKGPLDTEQWRVDRNAVVTALRTACAALPVREVVADPNLWQSELQALSAEGFPIVEFPQSPSRMVPAAQRFYEAVTTGAMRHDGHPAMARHIGNTVIKPNGHLAKGSASHHSGRKIDLAIAAVMAYERASVLGNVPARPKVFVI